MDFHCGNIAAVLKHAISLGNTPTCFHGDCPPDSCHLILSAETLTEFTAVFKEYLKLFLLQTGNSRSYLLITKTHGHQLLHNTCDSLNIKYFNITSKLPKFMAFFIEMTKTYLTFAENEESVVISDLNRPISYKALQNFKLTRNSDITSISEIFEDEIIANQDPELLRHYIGFPTTVLTKTFILRATKARPVAEQNVMINRVI